VKELFYPPRGLLWKMWIVLSTSVRTRVRHRRSDGSLVSQYTEDYKFIVQRKLSSPFIN
jgi:hypothetical protein